MYNRKIRNQDMRPKNRNIILWTLLATIATSSSVVAKTCDQNAYVNCITTDNKCLNACPLNEITTKDCISKCTNTMNDCIASTGCTD